MENRYPFLDGLLRSFPGAVWDYKAEWGWDRYQVGGRMFAALCVPGPEHKVYGGHPLLTLKCDPVRSLALQAEHPAILPGFYMDKRAWISVFLDADIPESLLRELCAESYRLVFEKLTKKAQREIEATKQ
ncbi:MAG: MmcQ/YjbR family DNA-binding protein [Clostridia bacterium]|nr:MmcQ/YjbR family DNA-binding protein [Clostridia bacterium]